MSGALALNLGVNSAQLARPDRERFRHTCTPFALKPFDRSTRVSAGPGACSEQRGGATSARNARACKTTVSPNAITNSNSKRPRKSPLDRGGCMAGSSYRLAIESRSRLVVADRMRGSSNWIMIGTPRTPSRRSRPDAFSKPLHRPQPPPHHAEFFQLLGIRHASLYPKPTYRRHP